MNYVHEAEIYRGQLKNEVESAAVWHDNWGFLAGRKQPPARGFSTNVAKYSYGAGQWSVKSVRVPDSSDEGMAAAKAEQDGRKLMSTLSWQTVPNKEVQPCAAKVRIFRSCTCSRARKRVCWRGQASCLAGTRPTLPACSPCAHSRACGASLGCNFFGAHPRLCCRLAALESQGIQLVKDAKVGVETREAAMLMRAHKFQSLGDACLTDGVDPGVKYFTPFLTSHEYGWRAPNTSNTRPSLEMFGVAEHGRKAVVKKFN